MPADADAPAGIAGNLLRALQNLGGSFLAIVQTRLELLSTEIEEEWIRLAGFALIALAALFCAGVAIVLAVVFVVAAFWDSYRLSAIVALGAVFVLIAVVLWQVLVLNLPWRHRKGNPIAQPQRFESLKKTAVEQYSLVTGFNEVARPGDSVGSSREGDFHSVSHNAAPLMSSINATL